MLHGLGEFFADVAGWLSGLGDVALELAASPLSLLFMFAFTVIDGFFPPVPSETVVIALSSLSMTGDGPPLWAILPVAAAGAFVGDVIAFSIGTKVPIRRLPWLRGARGGRIIAWAERTLAQRGGAFILSARYIPIGRVVVNMTAGALGYSRRRFAGFAAIGAASWAIYSTILGISAGAFLRHEPLLAVAVGVVLGIVVGSLVDVVMRRIFGTPNLALASSAQPEAEAEPVAPAA